jgi:ribosomal protein S18 acetylase RimI-like enzyme
LRAIAVRKELQGKGIGYKMMNYIEDYLRQGNKRILIVETSSDNHYQLTRKFYFKLNYILMATIKDFWNDGEDKIVFWKKLN